MLMVGVGEVLISNKVWYQNLAKASEWRFDYNEIRVIRILGEKSREFFIYLSQI